MAKFLGKFMPGDIEHALRIAHQIDIGETWFVPFDKQHKGLTHFDSALLTSMTFKMEHEDSMRYWESLNI